MRPSDTPCSSELHYSDKKTDRQMNRLQHVMWSYTVVEQPHIGLFTAQQCAIVFRLRHSLLVVQAAAAAVAAAGFRKNIMLSSSVCASTRTADLPLSP